MYNRWKVKENKRDEEKSPFLFMVSSKIKNKIKANRPAGKASLLFFVVVFLSSTILPAFASSAMPEFLCQVGIKFYHEGRYDDALMEFKKALLIQADYAPALKYIQQIEEMKLAPAISEEIPLVLKLPAGASPEAISKALDLIEMQREVITEKRLIAPKAITPFAPEIPLVKIETAVVSRKKISPPQILLLDESLSKLKQPIEIEMGKSVIIAGRNIQKFLVTSPEIITVERKSTDELLVTGKNIGYTYLHIWDDSGRWTTEWLGGFPRPEGPSYEELIRRQEEMARNFKLSYSLDWISLYTGRRWNSLDRSSYLYSHSLSLNGPTPYGDIDSVATIRTNNIITDLTYFTFGLTNGQIGPFKGFSLRGFDFSPSFSNFAFPGATLRGGMLTAAAFNNKLNYTAFWGREGGGRYGNLSPSLGKIKNSFLDGFNLDYAPGQKQDYKFTLVHGWGRDRGPLLNSYDYDLSGNWNFDKFGLGYDIANDSENFAHLFNIRYKQKKINFSAELRDINKSFNSITGSGWRQGQLGGLFNLNYNPTDKLWISSTLDVYQDRLFPAEDNINRWNEDLSLSTNYQLDPATSFNSSYTLQNELGRLSQYRYQNTGLGISKRIKFIKDISTYINYYHQENKSYSSPSSDYINDRMFAGLRFNLIGELYYYLNKEINWLQEQYTATWAHPNALEMGLDWSHQIGKSPFYGSFRFTYRDEEDTVSRISLLSGEDYIEGYTELSYRPASADIELYGSCRVRNVWADNPVVTKNMDADFNAGMRYLWDTGIHWDAVGNIEGYVFKDINSDGLRQRDEPPVAGVKVWLGKDKSQVTDLFGYYKFKEVKARKAYVTLDTSTLPAGFVLTVPVSQEVSIVNHRSSRTDFGIISHTQISGIVFEDVDGNGEYGRNDKGIKGAVLILDDGSKIATDSTGKYSFVNVVSGEHTINLDLNSLPVYYLPEVAITKKISLFEGVVYIYNIPLKRIKE
jgi:hypothetical protein